MKNWIVVANAARARVLEEADAGTGQAAPRYVHVADLVHPAGRQKGSQLAADRPGRVAGTGHGLGSAKFVPRTDPHEREREHFALELARLLEGGIAEGRCAGIVLVASHPFLGVLRSHLGARAEKAVLRTLAADYTGLDEVTIAARLATSARHP
ncbi:MAG: host attachment protein [Rubrivivax sp.]|nr:host attachment protein [Rubrivivax sp.]